MMLVSNNTHHTYLLWFDDEREGAGARVDCNECHEGCDVIPPFRAVLTKDLA
jgi:hypothetical protein